MIDLDYNNIEYMTSTQNPKYIAATAILTDAIKKNNEASNALKIAEYNLNKKQLEILPKIKAIQPQLKNMKDMVVIAQANLANIKKKYGNKSKEYKTAEIELDKLIKSDNIQDAVNDAVQLQLKSEKDAVERARNLYISTSRNVTSATSARDKLK